MRHRLLLRTLASALLLCIPGPAPASGGTPGGADFRVERLRETTAGAMGGIDAWRSARYLRWEHVVTEGGLETLRARHCWDRGTGRYRVEWGDPGGRRIEAWMDLDEPRGGVARADGVPASDREADRLLDAARERFASDSLWILLPWNWTDPGVLPTWIGTERKPGGGKWEVVLLELAAPRGDRHWVYVDGRSGLIGKSQALLGGEPGEPREFTWEDWQEAGGVKFSTRHRLRDGAPREIRIESLRVVAEPDEEAFALPPGLPDIFGSRVGSAAPAASSALPPETDLPAGDPNRPDAGARPDRRVPYGRPAPARDTRRPAAGKPPAGPGPDPPAAGAGAPPPRYPEELPPVEYPPPPGAAGFAPHPGRSPEGQLAVVLKGEDAVAIVDLATRATVKKIPTGRGPHEIVATPDGRFLVVSNYGAATPGSTLTVVSTRSLEVARTVDLSPHSRPHGLSAGPGGEIYVTAEDSRVLLVVDPETGDRLGAMPTQDETSHMVALDPRGGRAFVANTGSDTVSVVSLVDRKNRSVPAGRGPEGIALSPDGAELWVANRHEDTVLVLDASGLVPLATLRTGAFPIRVRFSPDGSLALVAEARAGEVSAWDPRSRERLGSASVGDTPMGIEISPDGAFAFVSATRSGRVTILALPSLEVVGTIGPGREPDGLCLVPGGGSP